MSDTEKLRPYRMMPLGDITSEKDVGLYLSQELRRIETSISKIVSTLKTLEDRMNTHGI